MRACIFCGYLQEKCHTLILRKPALIEMHMATYSQEPCVEINRENARILCEPAQSKCTWTLHKSHFVKVPNANPGAIVLCKPGLHIEKIAPRLKSSVCVCGNLQGKRQTLIPGPAFCASLHSRNTISQEPLCLKIYKGNPKGSSWGQNFA